GVCNVEAFPAFQPAANEGRGSSHLVALALLDGAEMLARTEVPDSGEDPFSIRIDLAHDCPGVVYTVPRLRLGFVAFDSAADCSLPRTHRPAYCACSSWTGISSSAGSWPRPPHGGHSASSEPCPLPWHKGHRENPAIAKVVDPVGGKGDCGGEPRERTERQEGRLPPT